MREDDPGSVDVDGVALGPHVSLNLRWLAEIMWGGLPGVGVCLGRPGPGRRAVERYVAVPSARSPRILLPAQRKQAAAAARAAGATRSTRSRAERAAAAAVLGSPAGRAVFRDVLTVHVEESSASPGLVSDLIEGFTRSPVALAINVRGPEPARKPVAIAVGPSGSIEAFAKIAWNGPTDANVRAEAYALREVAERVTALQAPMVKGETTWKGRHVLITSPMPGGLRRYPASDGPPPLDVTRDVACLFGDAEEGATFGPCRARLAERLARVQERSPLPDVAASLASLLGAAVSADGDAIVTGAWHGDWAPWNLGVRGDELWAWDWEYTRPDVPLGLDLLHFAFQVSFITERRGLAASLDHARAAAAPGLASLGWSDREQRLVHAFHLAELSLRMLEVASAGVAANPRFLAEAIPVLRAEADRLA